MSSRAAAAVELALYSFQLYVARAYLICRMQSMGLSLGFSSQ